MLLNQYDLLRLVLRVPLTPENRDQNAGYDLELPENRRWKGPCLGFNIPQDIRLVSPVQTEKSRAEQKK